MLVTGWFRVRAKVPLDSGTGVSRALLWAGGALSVHSYGLLRRTRLNGERILDSASSAVSSASGSVCKYRSVVAILA
jgi:hypothetical protein